jgi:hypothetical protein
MTQRKVFYKKKVVPVSTPPNSIIGLPDGNDGINWIHSSDYKP